jgi:hypothetical protein
VIEKWLVKNVLLSFINLFSPMRLFIRCCS